MDSKINDIGLLKTPKCF